MTEYYVRYIKPGCEECLIVLPSFLKLLIWFLRTGYSCSYITILQSKWIGGIDYGA